MSLPDSILEDVEKMKAALQECKMYGPYQLWATDDEGKTHHIDETGECDLCGTPCTYLQKMARDFNYER